MKFLFFETITIVGHSKKGQARAMDKYIIRVNDDRDITLRYDDLTKEWSGLDFTIRGQNIIYKRLTRFGE
jgi:hypothetical protein